jgi:hypothetical protein
VASSLVYMCTLTLSFTELIMVPIVAQKVASGVKNGIYVHSTVMC